MARPDGLVDTALLNAALSWTLVGVMSINVGVSLIDSDILWAGFGVAVIIIAILPAVISADVSVMVAWEVLLICACPALARLAGVGSGPLEYLSLAALGLLAVAEIDRFSSALMPSWFAATFVVMATMSFASVWAIVQYFANRWLGTAFATTVEALMWDLVVASVAGLTMALIFEGFLRDRIRGSHG